VGSTGNNLSWTFTDVSTSSPTYTVTRDGITILSDISCASGGYINISVDGLGAGYYTFVIEVDDGYDATVSDVVFVNVSSPEPVEEPDLLAMIMNFLNEYSVIIIPAIIGINIIIAAIIISRSMRKRPIETISASTKEISKSKQVKKTKNDSKPKDTEEDKSRKVKKKSNK